MFVIKKQLKSNLISILVVFLISFIIGFVYFGIEGNASLIYTTLLCIPFMIGSRLMQLSIDDIIEQKRHYSKKKSLIFHLAMINIFSNIFNILPFIIVTLVVFLTQNTLNVSIDSHPIFNIWLVMAIVLFIYVWNIANIIYNSCKKNIKLNKKQTL